MNYNPKEFASSLLKACGGKINEHNFSNMFAQINSILALSPAVEKKYAFVTNLRNCFDSCVASDKARIQYERANIALTEYYKSGKILDYIEKLRNFANNIDTKKEPTYISERGYNNYVYYLRLFTDELKNKYHDNNVTSNYSAYEYTPKNLCSFIKNDCTDIPVIKELPTVYENCVLIQKKLDNNQNFDTKDKEAYRHISDTLEFIKCCKGKRVDFITVALDNHLQAFEKKKNELDKSTKEGETLYRMICDILTDEWYDVLNPDIKNNPINSMTSAQIKDLYLKAIGKTSCITNRYKR